MAEKQNNQPEQPEQHDPQTPKKQQRKPLTEMERMQLKKRHEIELRKLRQEIREASTEQEKEDLYAEVHYTPKVSAKPKTFKGKWDNYWYHYKWLTIGLAFLGILLVMFVYDVVTKEKYDVQISMLSYTAYLDPEEQIQETQEKLSSYVQDYNRDDKENVQLTAISLDRDNIDSLDPNMVMAMTTKMQANFMDTEVLIYLMDRNYYDYYTEAGIEFVDLSAYSSNPNVDQERYAVKDDEDFSSLNGKDELYLVVRDISGLSDKKREKATEHFEQQLEIVKQIIAE